jgi:multidrug efflux system outer membrane protein
MAKAAGLSGLVIGLLVLLPGCAGLSPSEPLPTEPDVPAAWSDTNGSAGDGARPGWWKRFDDPLLPMLVAQALRDNTRVLEARAAWQQAQAQQQAAAAGLQPTLDASASAQRSTREGTGSSDNVQAGLDAAWAPDLFGGRRAALASAQAGTRVRAATLGQTEVAVSAEVGLGYIALRSAQARLAVADANLALQEETLQLTGWRVQAGLLSELEGEQARAATAQTRAQIPALRTSVAQAGHTLAVLTGQPPAALQRQLATPAALPVPPESLTASLPADTLRQRADVHAAGEQVLAAQGRVAQADAARYPSLRIGGSLGLNALTLGSLGSAGLVSSLLASISLPLWDGGSARAEVQSQQAALMQARAAYRGTVLVALRQVEDALVALRGDRERLARLQEAADAATTAASLARLRFDSGLVDFQTVLETQRSRLGAQDSLASAAADVSADHVRLYLALGGGWRPDQETPPMAQAPR